MKTQFITLLILVILILTSCNDDTYRKGVIITDFNSTFIDSLTPDKKRIQSYTTYNVILKGKVNDTIEIRLSKNKGDVSNSFYYSGEIDSRIHDDYYGEEVRYIYFNPYKASKGQLEINYRLE